MKIVMIGAGGLASNLAPALRAAGHEVIAVYSRTMASASTLAAAIGSRPYDTIADLPVKADCFMMAVKDSALAEVLAELVKGREEQLFVHTAGSVPMSLLADCAVNCGVFWPMQTFSRQRRVGFADVPVFIEGSSTDVLAKLELLAGSIGSRVCRLSSEERKYMHLAAVFACNFTNHCYALAARILEQHGVPFGVMLPLIGETARKVQEVHPVAAQTGPAVRYDENVIGRQIALLQGQPEMQAIYEMLSQSIHHTATGK